MASPKVFLTGASGYIGGDALYAIANAHSDWQLSALIRNKDKAEQVKAQYPNIRIIHGDLDSSDIIIEEVKNADIVFHFADRDHVAAAQAISKGAENHTAERPLWLIHTSGSAILTVEDRRAHTYGIERPKQYNDWEGVNELINLPDDAYHRNVEKIILDTGKRHPSSVRTAIAYWLSAAVLKRGKGFLVGKGENIWHQVHVQDLSDVYEALGAAAAAGGGKATWNDEGYYFVENGAFVWGDIQRKIAEEAYAQKFIQSPEVDSLDDVQITDIHPAGWYAWGSNSRGHAIRARKLFGWDPKRPSLIELIPDIVALEAKDLGLI
ncbi:putative nucleoside-diphosphate-sugar epimerase [Aspergillus ibericus CBS 121593]|uniref:Putative nucleoside-diphosphate-sugar epimerase n=1 Tax=Aspergillus ibericus CBS 121593 TaxID=1448316 RepID=A0A395H660_9EURO|nr:putative nucleoside-diphosphate-sugar epimerase [Aspergillus ibericus CBS 121593]RAL03381.1 putative nucleoside-diphosphate-sugar epimerase [Aspergillus ibericus CBS 121593]